MFRSDRMAGIDADQRRSRGSHADIDGRAGTGAAGVASAHRGGSVGGRSFDRRRLLSLAGMTAALPLAACGGGSGEGSGAVRPVRIGYVSPQTGSLSAFGDADTYVTDSMRAHFKNGVPIGSRTHPVEIIVRDTQSDQSRAAQAANDLIFLDRVDLILVTSTPDTVNPVADQCEANEVPCISTGAPWQSWFSGRGGSAEKPFKWTYHFFWGIEDVTSVDLNMWGQLPTNRKVGVLWPTDADGQQFSAGFRPAMAARGYTVVDPGPIPVGTKDFTGALSAFEAQDVEILTGVMPPADFAEFWRQAVQKNFRPKIVTMAKALLFPSSVQALGTNAHNLATEVWWSPYHSYRSSLTGATPQALADEFSNRTGKPWLQTLGFAHALYEVAAEALAQAGNVDDRQALATAIGKVRMNTIVGPIAFGGMPQIPRNVSKTPLVGGQWRADDNGYKLFIVNDGGNGGIVSQSQPLQPYGAVSA